MSTRSRAGRTRTRKVSLKYRRHIISKWLKTKALLANSRFRSVIPVTKVMTRDSLKSMLSQYKMVYVKPDIGTFGNGVIRVEQKEGGQPYQYQHGESIRRFADYDAMYKALRKLTRRRKYLVQKGIHLLKFRKCRFDLRIMVQRTPRQTWETTGIIGRVAHPRKIVTNFHNGGKLTPVGTLLKAYVPAGQRKSYIQSLSGLGVRLAKQLHQRYRGLKEIGADVGLDQSLHPWVLEVNTSPDPYIFRRLKDKSIFAKIRRYARAYQKRV